MYRLTLTGFYVFLDCVCIFFSVLIAYSTYHFFNLGRPNQLAKQQVEQIKLINNGAPVSAEIIKIEADRLFSKELDLRENDVFFMDLIKL